MGWSANEGQICKLKHYKKKNDFLKIKKITFLENLLELKPVAAGLFEPKLVAKGLLEANVLLSGCILLDCPGSFR